jgi:O-antigen ligase
MPADGRSRVGAAFAAERWTAWLEAVLDAAAFLLLPLLVLAPRGVAPLAAVAGLCAGGLVLPVRRLAPWRGLAGPALLLAMLVAWGAVSALWAIEPRQSVAQAVRLAGLLAAGMALAAAVDCIAAPARLSRLLCLGFVVAAALAVADFMSRGALTQPFSTRPYQPAWLNQAANGLAILLLPGTAAIAGCGRRRLALIFAAVGTATILGLVGSAPKVALCAGVVTAACCYLAGRRIVLIARAMACLSVVVIVTAPLSFGRLERLPLLPELAESIKQSAEHRLLIWSFVGDRIAEHPLSGWGLAASRVIPGGRQPIRHGETWLPLHPHNAPLQLWLELGAPGAVLGALLTAVFWRRLAAAAWPLGFKAAAGGSLAAASAACLGTYGIWQEWWLGTLLFAQFLVQVMARAAAGAGPHPAGRTPDPSHSRGTDRRVGLCSRLGLKYAAARTPDRDGRRREQLRAAV